MFYVIMRAPRLSLSCVPKKKWELLVWPRGTSSTVVGRGSSRYPRVLGSSLRGAVRAGTSQSRILRTRWHTPLAPSYRGSQAVGSDRTFIYSGYMLRVFKRAVVPAPQDQALLPSSYQGRTGSTLLIQSCKRIRRRTCVPIGLPSLTVSSTLATSRRLLSRFTSPGMIGPPHWYPHIITEK